VGFSGFFEVPPTPKKTVGDNPASYIDDPLVYFNFNNNYVEEISASIKKSRQKSVFMISA
jgi:hypothetical protein